jgi:exodeoxyribonuclease VIII
MKDIMLDLETMGNGPDAAIIAIGAIDFDVDTCKTGTGFYVHVDLASSVAAGGIIDPSTVLWWMKQNDQARGAFARPGEKIAVALHLFAEWVSVRGARNEVRVWGNGAAFDNVILASAYRRLDLVPPWEFWNDRCYRTMKAQYPDIKLQRAGTHHNAIDDAISQADHLLAMLTPAPAKTA